MYAELSTSMTPVLSTSTKAKGRKKAPAVPRARKEESIKFGNDGSLESVQRQLKKLAMKCFARAQAIGISMDFEDVHQEMLFSYVKAKAKWNPQGGALFTTYCQTVCLNNFNAAIAKMERERSIGKGDATYTNPDGTKVTFPRAYGMVSECEFIKPWVEKEKGSKTDMSFADAAHSLLDDTSNQPEYRLASSQETAEKVSKLSPGARRLVALLLDSERQRGDTPKLSALARLARLNGDELRRVKLEIFNLYGVKWH